MLGGTEFSTVSDADFPEITEMAQAVRWPHRPEDVALLASLGRGQLLRSIETGEAIAVGMWWPFGDLHARLGMIIVHPKHQGRGLGREMVTRLLSEAEGRSLSLLATEAGKPLYESFGFQSTGAVLQIQGELKTVPDRNSSVTQTGQEVLPEIIRLDKAATGLDRSMMLSALARSGRIAVHGSAGYAIERSFGRGSVVGPIVSDTEETAVELFNALARPGFVRVDCVSTASCLHNHLVRQGLEPVDADAIVMLRGDAPPIEAGTGLWTLASQALG